MTETVGRYTVIIGTTVVVFVILRVMHVDDFTCGMAWMLTWNGTCDLIDWWSARHD